MFVERRRGHGGFMVLTGGGTASVSKRTVLTRLGVVGLGLIFVLGALHARANDGVGARASAELGTAPDAPTSSTMLRPWIEAEARFCVASVELAHLSVQQMSGLAGSTVQRAEAVASLRAGRHRLRAVAPSEIAEAVETLTAIADRYYDALEVNGFDLGSIPSAIAAEQTSDAARAAENQQASYLRDHCGTDT
jgi:hypothetical protein